jgi:hypothetical protein
MQPNYVADVLRIFQQADVYDGLLWQVPPDGTVTFAAMCSDCFWWGTADAEDIEPDDIELLQRCLDDLQKFGDEDYLIGNLFAARKRGMRPMRLWLETLETPATVTLFMAAGPKRDPKDEG